MSEKILQTIRDRKGRVGFSKWQRHQRISRMDIV